MKTVITSSGQTLIDIAVQEYGNIEAVKQLLLDNPGLLIDYSDADPGELETTNTLPTDIDMGFPLRSGQVLLIDDAYEFSDRSVVKQLKGNLIISE